MTLLDIVADAAVMVGLSEPSAVSTSTDPSIKRMLRFANQIGRELANWHDWQNLIVEQTFTTLATQEQTNAFPPADYLRLVYNVEVWNRSKNRRLTGPTRQRDWQYLLSASVTAAANGYWRIIGNQLNVLPVMDAGDTLAFEYISKNWAQSSGGDAQDSFMADTDVSLIPEQLFTLGIIWKHKSARGLSYAEDFRTYETERRKLAGVDRGTGRRRPESSNYGEPPEPAWSGVISV